MKPEVKVIYDALHFHGIIAYSGYELIAEDILSKLAALSPAKQEQDTIGINDLDRLIESLTFNTEDQAGVKFNCLVVDELREKLGMLPALPSTLEEK